MKIFLSLLVGVALGVAGYWYFNQPPTRDFVARARDNVKGDTGKVESSVSKIESSTSSNMENTAAKAGESLKQTFDPDKIKDELTRTGQVVREKAGQVGTAIADAAANARITATVKTKLVEDTGLAAFKINVDTTDGVVTLSGTVSDYDDIARAMSIALEVDGVQKVISTIQIKTPVSFERERLDPDQLKRMNTFAI